MGLLIASLLTIAALGVIFLAAFRRLWVTPPVITFSVNLPASLQLRLQHEPATLEGKSAEEPIPVEIVEYISMESELAAQDARKRRARELKRDTGSWDAAFRLLQREDATPV